MTASRHPDPELREGEGPHELLLLETRADDPTIVARAVWRATQLLRTNDWPVSLGGALALRFVELASHPNASPRQAVAEALAYLPDDVYAELQPRLVEDPNRPVTLAAKAAPGLRATRKREEAQVEDEDARLARWYSKLGPRERRIAGRIGDQQTEYYVRREHHEIDHVLRDMERHLARLARLAPSEDDARGAREELAGLREDIEQVRRILTESRENAEPIEPAFQKENLLSLVRAQADGLAARFPDRKDRLDVDLSTMDPRLEPIVDAGYLRQAVANLLRNAVEAYDPDAPRIRVEVSAAAMGDYAVLAVADEGMGIPEDQIASCFVPFGSKKKGGTGFGLYNARRVARQVHGGDLQLESKEGKGTTVTLTLPLQQEEANANGAKKPKKPSKRAKA